MTLYFAPDQANAISLVEAGLARMAARRSPGAVRSRVVALTQRSICHAHPVYDLRLDDIRSGKRLEAAHETSLRYLVKDGDVAVAAAELEVDSAGQAQRLTNLNFGPFPGATSTALDRLQSELAASGPSYDVRLLRSSAIFVVAIWLKGRDGAADVLVPVAPAPHQLSAMKRYGADELMAVARLLGAQPNMGDMQP